jgi:hypothetical protein
MKKYVCVKDYVTSEGDVAFKQGKIYEITSNGMLYSELAGVKYYLTEQFKKVNFKKYRPVKSFGGKGLYDASNCLPVTMWTGTGTAINLNDSGKELMRIDSNYNIKIKDSVVESVIKKFQDRSRVGIEKYGTTLDRKDIDFDGWAEHMQMELMDGILYLERLRNEERRNK